MQMMEKKEINFFGRDEGLSETAFNAFFWFFKNNFPDQLTTATSSIFFL